MTASGCYRTRERCGGFTLVELTIVVLILGILAAIVIPKFTSASDEARSANTLSQLRTVRVALNRYRLDHDETYPTLGQMWTNLTTKTDLDGTVNASGIFGPYLLDAPKNPYTQSSTVVVLGDGTASDGWGYDTTDDQVIYAVGFDEATEEYTAP